MVPMSVPFLVQLLQSCWHVHREDGRSTVKFFVLAQCAQAIQGNLDGAKACEITLMFDSCVIFITLPCDMLF